MKNLFFILSILFFSNFSYAQPQTKDTMQCKTFIKFINKTKLKLEITIYDRVPDGKFPPPNVVNVFTIAPGKEKKMKGEDGLTYFYGAQQPVNGLVEIGVGSSHIWKGSVDAEECKTIEEIIE